MYLRLPPEAYATRLAQAMHSFQPSFTNGNNTTMPDWHCNAPAYLPVGKWGPSVPQKDCLMLTNGNNC